MILGGGKEKKTFSGNVIKSYFHFCCAPYSVFLQNGAYIEINVISLW